MLLLPLYTLSQNLSQKLAKAYSVFATDSQHAFAISSLTVLNALTGEIILSNTGSTGLAPASTLKTVTSATAYYILGQDFKWKTTLGYSGDISLEGILKGDLILNGTGDPTLGSDRYPQSKPEILLRRWVSVIQQAGIKQIEGRVITDDLLFGTQTIPQGWIWQDIGNYYGAGSSSVCWNENQFDIVFQAGKPREPTKFVRTEPKVDYLKIINEVKTGEAGTGDQVYAYSAPFSNMVYLRGTYAVDLKKNVSVSFPDPGFEAAFRISEGLKKAGISIRNLPSTNRILTSGDEPATKAATTLDTYYSPSLDSVVYWLNQKSLNLYAENLLKTIALHESKEATTENGIEILKTFWVKKLNLDKRSMNVLDGSGLSPENKISTLTMAQILRSVQKEAFFKSFYKSLPVYNDMKMKSGTIRDGLAYAGYQTTSSGTQVVFSFIVNGFNGSTKEMRQKMFKVLDVLK